MSAVVEKAPLKPSIDNNSIKKLGVRLWRKIHVLIYPASILAGLHFVMVKKVWELEPLIYSIIILGLLIFRFVSIFRKI